ncbi:TrkH family potassium uptake protein [Cesiribacter andamanensis]|uniref:Ktr system potassium uptake protein B n=1 Tax=Cesiribacter andamanensis AMV16 TaxID=1279009 RepID=M7N6J8_9BACT|nr:potassium transporter TrkG [Cesiribacter andamanensis]EMR02846.1 Ktr system potassium uptake protein B [Cesiribacter andamanensis AMV16]
MNLRRIKNDLAESLNRLLYESRTKAYTSIRSVTFISSLTAVALLVYNIGYELSPMEQRQVYYGLDLVFLIFVLTYVARWLYSFRRTDFIIRHKFEGVLMGIILLNGLSVYLLDIALIPRLLGELGLANPVELYHFFIGCFMFLLLVYEFGVATTRLGNLNVRPATAFIFSFLILISLGTALLMLPDMTRAPGSMPFLEALFTSVSACCVTGLIVVDTATYFTLKGQLVIMLLIQLGGLGILSFASFFTLIFRQGVGIRHQVMLQDFLSSESLLTARGLLRQIVLMTFFIEFIGFLLIFSTWSPDVKFSSIDQKIFFSAFHSVSAFCNAGFSLYTNGLYENLVREAYVMHLVIAGLVIFGGIGFPVIQDLFSRKRLRDRLRNPWKDWQLGTKIAVYVSASLLLFGTLMFYVLEYDNTLKGLTLLEAVITSFFQSMTTRTAGFNTVDIGALRLPTYIIFMFLMFIGASSGSIGGGIKTSTFFLVVASTIATVQGKAKLEIGKNFISTSLVFRALSVFIFAVGVNILGILLLTITEPGMELRSLVFEQVSAFATVGLSTGITAELSDMSRIIIICSMFIGRVGTITFALAFTSRVSTRAYQYPKAHLMVG